MKKKAKSIASATAAIVFAAFILSSVIYYQYSIHAEKKDVETIKVAYLPITHSLPVLELAKKLDADKNSDIKIELVKYGSWPELMDALSSGNVDAASVLVELAIKAYDSGSHLQLAALGHRDGNVIIGSNDIKSAEDLKGKSVAIPSPQSSHNILLRLRKSSLKHFKDIRKVWIAQDPDFSYVSAIFSVMPRRPILVIHSLGMRVSVMTRSKSVGRA